MTDSLRPDYNHRVLIVGCGDIGSRHLQAVSTLPEVKEIQVVDPRPEASALGQKRLAEMPGRQTDTEVRWFLSLEEASFGGGLCIVASQAEGRCQLTRRVTETLGYKSFILEKLVAQSVLEMEDLIEFHAANNVSAWANCKSRAYQFHQRAKEWMDPSEPIIFDSMGSNHGLATEGVHSVDLFAFYDEASWIKSTESQIDPVLHPSKRGQTIFDLSGALHGYSQKGSRFTISHTQSDDSWGHISIATAKYRCIVDHLQRCAFESDSDSGWVWRPAPFDGPILISEMTRDFASDILSQGRCELPTLEESLLAHRFILDELRPHFSRLLGRKLERCPVT